MNWPIGTARNINWTHNLGTGETARVELSRDGGANWVVLAAVPNTGNTSGTFNWMVDGPVTTTARVRVVWATNPAVQDESDGNFSVTSRITVTAPNTAVTWGAGSRRTITWNHNYGAAQSFDIFFSPDLGGTWQTAATSVPAATATTGSFTVPMSPTVTTQALIRVSPSGSPGDGDVSNNPFTLDHGNRDRDCAELERELDDRLVAQHHVVAQPRHPRGCEHRRQPRRRFHLDADCRECDEHRERFRNLLVDGDRTGHHYRTHSHTVGGDPGGRGR